MTHSDKMVAFLQNTKPKALIDLPYGCPECGSKFVERQGNLVVCKQGHTVQA